MVSNLVLIGVVGRSREEYALASELDRLLTVDCVAVESLRAQVVKVAAPIEAWPARLLEDGLSGPVLVDGVQECGRISLDLDVIGRTTSWKEDLFELGAFRDALAELCVEAEAIDVLLGTDCGIG